MQKRGQVTLFVILGIILVSFIGIGIYYKIVLSEKEIQNTFAEREALTQAEKEVAEFIDGCVKQTLETGLLSVLGDGGYYPPEEGSLLYLSYTVPYYLKNRVEKKPSLKDIDLSLERYINAHLVNCLTGEIEVLFNPQSSVRFGTTIQVDVEMPVVFGESRLHSFFTSLDLDFPMLYSRLMGFYDLVHSFNATVDLISLGEILTDEYSYTFETFNATSVYLLFIENLMPQQNLTFSFALQKESLEEDLLDQEILALFFEEEGDIKEEDIFNEDDFLFLDLLNFSETEIPLDFNETLLREEGVL